ncbi:patatin-like phospholipase family protein [Wenzhouxiangella limi]|uniref:Serine protease n=1 Tax=Wenzhouxiangella limi TaxID=2707351 RepID=A0A845V1E3_9GAMM|nr:patatin-like phospholipase family protein [Wenzhouxiangella limi]NDY96050.1 serine protease [Wenzhouxiangella limi]
MSEQKPLSGKTVSLVLGSGGARGLAHIGVIRALEDAGAEIEAIAGSSMGALVGGIHAAGQLQAYEDWVCGLKQSDVLSLVDWSFAGGGLIKGRKIIGKLEELVGDLEIRDLKIDFTAVAVDIEQGREVWLDRGSLFDAIRASIAIPGIFTPHRYRNRVLVDGGLLNPIPVAPTLRCMTNLTMVADVNGPADPKLDEKENETEKDSGEGSVWDKLRDFVDNFAGDKDPSETQPGLFAVMMRSLDTMEAALTRQHLAIFQPDLVVRIPKNACMVHEFHRARRVIDLGAGLTRAAIENKDKGYPDAG